jgi:hypothetical protein
MKTRADRKPFSPRTMITTPAPHLYLPFPPQPNCNSTKTLRNKERFFSLILKRQPNRKLDDSRISSARDLAEERAVDVCTRI